MNSLISSLRRQAQKTIEIPVKNSNNNNNSDTKSSSKSRRVIERERELRRNDNACFRKLRRANEQTNDQGRAAKGLTGYVVLDSGTK